MSSNNRPTPEPRMPRANGHAPSQLNGHAGESDLTAAEQGAPAVNTSPQKVSTKRSRARAAADDPHDAPYATTAAPPPAGKARDTSAAAACDSNTDPLPEEVAKPEA